MKEIFELEGLGYVFSVTDGSVQYEFIGSNLERDQDVTRQHLLFIKAHREDAISFLEERNKPVDLLTRLRQATEKAYLDKDWDRWIRLGEAYHLERSKAYAQNEYDRRRCPQCPYLGKGSIDQIGGEVIVCDVSCPK